MITSFPATPKERVKYAMAFASRYLANVSSDKITVRLKGKDKVESLYIWTALMVMGESSVFPGINPQKIRFDQNAIKNYCFDDADQLGGWFSRFSSTSLYETSFKQHITADMLVISKTAPLFVDIDGKLSQEEQERLYKERQDGARRLPEELETRSSSISVGARVEHAINYAKEVIAARGMPGPKNKVEIKDVTTEEAKYLWTAFMVLGDGLGARSFGADAIVNKVEDFNEKAEQGWLSRYSSSSLYETTFKIYLTPEMRELGKYTSAYIPLANEVANIANL